MPPFLMLAVGRGGCSLQSVSTSAFCSPEIEKVIISIVSLGGVRGLDTNHLDGFLAAGCNSISARFRACGTFQTSSRRPRKLSEARACLPSSICSAKGVCTLEGVMIFRPPEIHLKPGLIVLQGLADRISNQTA